MKTEFLDERKGTSLSGPDSSTDHLEEPCPVSSPRKRVKGTFPFLPQSWLQIESELLLSPHASDSYRPHYTGVPNILHGHDRTVIWEISR